MNVLAILVEFLGTFIFLSVIVATGNAWAIGGTLGGAISGGHFNPAVTAMTLYNRGIAMDSAVLYIVAQVAAGLLAVTVYNQMKKRSVV
jgi:glycerol uptake facilitator-like aquaporin